MRTKEEINDPENYQAVTALTWEWKETGESGFYIIFTDRDSEASIQLKGTLSRQRQYMDAITEALGKLRPVDERHFDLTRPPPYTETFFFKGLTDGYKTEEEVLKQMEFIDVDGKPQWIDFNFNHQIVWEYNEEKKVKVYSSRPRTAENNNLI